MNFAKSIPLNLIKLTLIFLAFCTFSLGEVNAGVYTVTNLTDSGAGSLRQAVTDANTAGGLDTIQFSVAGAINIGGQLPAITSPVIFDGTSAPGFVPCGAPVVALNYTGAVGAHGILFLAGGDGSSVLSLNIRGFTAAGVSVEFASAITIKGCYIGTDSTGNVADGNNLGIFILGSPDCVIGGDTCDRNVVSGNLANAIALENGSHRGVIFGNYVGLGADGVTPLGNGLESVYAFNSDSLQIGGTGPGEGNIITNGAAQGIHLNGGSDYATIYNNYIGINPALDTGYGNALNGIFLENGSSYAIIGDTINKNVISRNGLHGVQVNKTSDFNPIIGNRIFCNLDSGISLDTGNMDIPWVPNLFSAPDSVFGTGGTPGNRIHAYRNTTEGNDSLLCDCEGEIYIGTAVIQPSGDWAVVHGLGLSGAELGAVTVTQTDSMNNTSEYFEPCSGGVPTSIADVIEAGEGITVFPNPAAYFFSVHSPLSKPGERDLRIMNMNGEVVYSTKSTDELVSVNSAMFSNGLYFVVLTQGDFVQTGKILVQH